MKISYLSALGILLLSVRPGWSQAQIQTVAAPDATSAAIQNSTQPGAPEPGTLGDGSKIKDIPELYPGETSDFGTQELVKEKTRRKWVEADLNWQYGYNDNYLLETVPDASVTGGKLQTTQMLSTWEFAFAPDPFTYNNLKIYPRVGFRQTFWNYGIGTGQNSNFAAYNFYTNTVYGEDRVDFGNGWSGTLGADWTSIVSTYSDSEIYRQVGPRWGVSRQFKINDYNVINVSLDQQYLYTEVAIDAAEQLDDNIYDRLNTTFGVSYVYSPMDKVFLVPFYRMTHSWYPKFEYASISGLESQDVEDRSDFTNTFGLNATYVLNDYVSLHAAISYEKRYTTYQNPNNDPTGSAVPQYGNFQAGMGGGVTIRF